ncbi:MAG: ABC transporter, partial [Oscillospiraceae bacterium]|nr:ABC transporter [Oscillospiraceae bacterium]
KFLGAYVLYCICMACFAVYALVLSFFATPQWIQIFCTLLGLLLYGAALIAINIFISALTESQMVAAIAGMGAGILIYMFNRLADSVAFDWLKSIINGVSFENRYNSFTTGVLNIADVVFFLSATALFLFFTIRIFDKKRWG